MVNGMQLVIAGAAVCVLALLLVVLARRRRNAAGTDARIDDHGGDAVGAVDAVAAVAADEPGRVVLARTHDGTQYQGVLAEPDEAHAGGAYLVLTGPIVFRRSGGEAETMPSEWDRLAVPLSDVAELWTRPANVEPTASHRRADSGHRHPREKSTAAAPTP